MFDIYNNYREQFIYGRTATANTTITLLTPTSSFRAVITGTDIANSSGASGTCYITFGNLAGIRAVVANLLASTTLQYVFPNGLDNNVYDQTIHAVSSVVPMDVLLRYKEVN